jgi:hypothetical protein
LAGAQPALGDEFGVGVGDRVAGDAEVGGERAVRRQPDVRSEPSGADGVAQRLLDRVAATARAARHFDETELGHLLAVTFAINTWNRIAEHRPLTEGRVRETGWRAALG